MEIPVRVQGSQVSLRDATEHSEFFEEDTSTLILFPQGAVIRLGAAVNPGQRLAVTNLKTSQDVLCRVVNVRRYPDVKGYVEIEFTRSATGFWGVHFPPEVPATAGRTVGPAVSGEPKAPPANLTFPATAPAGPNMPVAAPPSFHPAPEPSVPASVGSSAPTAPTVAAKTKAKEQPVDSAPPVQAVAPAAKGGSAAAAKAAEVWELSAPAVVVEPGAKEQNVESAPTVDTAAHTIERSPAATRLSSADAWELSIPATGGSTMAPPRPARLEAEPIDDDESVAGMARPRPSGNLGSPLGRFEREAALPSHDSSPPEVLGRLAEESAPVRSVRYRRPPRRLLLASVSVVAVGLAVAAGAMFFRRHPERIIGAVSSSAVAAPASSANSAAQLKTQPEVVAPATPGQPVVGPDIELSTREQNSAEARVLGEIKGSAGTPRLPAASSKPNTPTAASPVVTGETARTEAPKAAAVKPTAPPVPRKVVASKPAARARTAEKQLAPSEVPQIPAITGDVPGTAPGAPASSIMGGIVSGASRANAEPAPPSAPEAETPVRAAGQMRKPRLLYSVQPVYPTVAKENRVQGDVVIQADVDATGKVVAMSVVSGPLMLRPPALAALRRWRYEPTKLNGQPVPAQLTVTMKFRLK